MNDRKRLFGPTLYFVSSTIVEKTDHLGGQFALAWQAPGKGAMKEGLTGLELAVKGCGASTRWLKTIERKFLRSYLLTNND